MYFNKSLYQQNTQYHHVKYRLEPPRFNQEYSTAAYTDTEKK